MFFYFGLLWEDFRYISQFSRGTNRTRVSLVLFLFLFYFLSCFFFIIFKLQTADQSLFLIYLFPVKALYPPFATSGGVGRVGISPKGGPPGNLARRCTAQSGSSVGACTFVLRLRRITMAPRPAEEGISSTCHGTCSPVVNGIGSGSCGEFNMTPIAVRFSIL